MTSSSSDSNETESEYGSDAEIQVTFEFDCIQENDYHGALQLLKTGIYSELFPAVATAEKKGKKRKRTNNNSIEAFVDSLISEAATSVSRLEYDDSPVSLLTLLSSSSTAAWDNLPILLMEKLSNIPPHCTPQLFRHFLSQPKQSEKISNLISENASIILVTRDYVEESDPKESLLLFPEYEFFEKQAVKKRSFKGKNHLLLEVKASKLHEIIDEMELAMKE